MAKPPSSPTPYSLSLTPKPHILFLASWYPNRIEPQNGNFVQRHAAAVSLLAQVSVIHILTDFDVFETEYTVEKNGALLEIVGYMPKVSSHHPWRKWKQYLTAYQGAYRLLLEHRSSPDLTHLNITFPAGLFACWLKRKYGLPLVLTEHWTSYLPSSPYRFNAQERFTIWALSKTVDVCCPVSADLGKAMKKYGFPPTFEVIPNVVDTGLFQPKLTKTLTPTRLIHVSTLADPHKNVSGILRSFHSIRLHHPETTLMLIGNGFVEKHRSYAAELGIPDSHIQIFGEQPIEEIARQMARHDVFVLFSNYENLPCVISEAHACGLPVISTDVGGIREMIDSSNGLLIETKDENGMVDAFEQMTQDWQQYDPVEIAEAAQKRYSYAAVARRYMSIYHQVMQ